MKISNVRKVENKMNDNLNKIVMIPRELLTPHPDNPRKNLGDLSELRESIREHGVMQNLTVLIDSELNEGGYTILIGHRRFAASEGILDELPCVTVKGLSHKEQVGIMLCENMQRSDLTFMEQAQGFQMMLDLGDTIQTVSKKTGFSEATVKHRLEIAKLDQKTLKETQEIFQLSISDFIELEKVKDLEVRNDILSEVTNSAELKDEVKSYLQDQLIEANFKKYEEVLKKKGWKEYKNRWFYFYDGSFNKCSIPDIDLLEPFDATSIEDCTDKNVLYAVSGGHLNFAIKADKKKKEKHVKTSEELYQDKIKNRKNELRKAREEISNEIIGFIGTIPRKRLTGITDESFKTIVERMFELLFRAEADLQNYLSEHYYTDNQDLKKLIDYYTDLHIIQRLMMQCWNVIDGSWRHDLYSGGYSEIKPNEEGLKFYQDFYNILFCFGFRFSDDEYMALVDGTSELYKVE